MKFSAALVLCLAVGGTAACNDRSEAQAGPASPPKAEHQEPTAVPSADLKARLFPSKWVAVEIHGQPVVTGSDITLEFDAADRIFGRGGCNRFTGGVTLIGDNLTFLPVAATQMACMDEAVGRQEFAYFATLSGTARAVLTPEGLELHTAAHKPTRFKAALAPVKITGTVTYRQRIALPPGAQLEVKIEDVSLADAPAELIAEKKVAIDGQVPVAFEIEVDPASIREGRSYALRAAILLQDKLLFTTDTRVAVLEPGASTALDLTLVQVSAP